jgi:hypothetical protein
MILTAGFKPSLQAKIMGANLKVLVKKKDFALKTETLEGEKRAKPNVQVDQVENHDEDTDAINYGNNRGGHNQGFQVSSSQFRGGEYNNNQPPHRSKGGQENPIKIEEEENKISTHRQQLHHKDEEEAKTETMSNGQTSNWCANCKKPTHSTVLG